VRRKIRNPTFEIWNRFKTFENPELKRCRKNSSLRVLVGCGGGSVIIRLGVEVDSSRLAAGNHDGPNPAKPKV
jgi:hypothetical protein